MQKRVVLLGAGFSREIGAPLQSQILPKLLQLGATNLSAPENAAFIASRDKLTAFLTGQMLADLSAGGVLLDLEDIYTPLDKCQMNGQAFRNLALEQVVEVRKTVDTAISLFMKSELDPIQTAGSYISRFASEIVQMRQTYPKKDTIAILSTNWDILLDNAVHDALNGRKGVIDYCCNAVGFDGPGNVMPALMAKGAGYFTVKLLKLHGSLNWLYCPRCGRLYTTYDQKIAVKVYIDQPECRLCSKNYGNKGTNDSGPRLVSQLLMPTYIKDLNNAQVKLIWQNAGIEISEAQRIIFIGYSFPTADFELRQLLARMVPHTARIEVVLNGGPDIDAEKRYKSFFGTRKIDFIYGGAAQYLDSGRWKT